jgi:hypothetical protein
MNKRRSHTNDRQTLFRAEKHDAILSRQLKGSHVLS